MREKDLFGSEIRHTSIAHPLNSMVKGSDEYLTPPEIIKALGIFDLDPCVADEMPWRTALNHFDKTDDGLCLNWRGRVWLNPPYGREVGKWLWKLAEHGNGIALIFARTDTQFFHESVWNRASGILFLKGRLHFYATNGKRYPHNSGAPSCLVAYGKLNAAMLQDSGIEGFYISTMNSKKY